MIIGFAGRKQSGKTTLAKTLQQEENAVIITIADFLKRLCCDLISMSYEELIEKKDNGYTFDVTPDERWFKIINEKTGIDINSIRKELKGKHITTIRQLLQFIGTDVIRKYNENWHVQKMVEAIESYPKDKLIVVDDVRFPNEREAILKRSGRVFFIVRSDVSNVSNHSSETALKWQDFNLKDIILNSNISLNVLKSQFIVFYKVNFKYIDAFYNTIFLYGSKEDYLKCANFGYGYDKNDELLTDILSQIKDNDLFKKYGIIEYCPKNNAMANRFINEVDNSLCGMTDYRKIFTTYNPLILENLKAFL